MATFAELREQYPVFRFLSYDLTETPNTLEITYHFEIDGLAAFAPHWSFPKSMRYPLYTADNATLREMVFSLGLVELISYWKLTCSPRVEILAGALDTAQIHWWKRLYFHGLGEFFYRNGIAPDRETFMDIRSLGSAPEGKHEIDGAFSGCLIPVGGGKDSAVTLELLKKQQDTNYCYIINPRGATRNTVQAAGYTASHVIATSRTLDPAMLALNKQGFLNGHTPFSALVAFSGLIVAYIHRLQYIVLSNESSANESTVAGSTVNHQYSKSFAFEQDFATYQQTYIGTSILYFSLLRPLSEFQIARLFAKMTPYHRVFRSCNVGSKEDRWCCHCSKCLFVFLMLSPFLSQDYLTELFGCNMLQDDSLLTVFQQLIGILEEKPFECVGSRDEANAAATLAVQTLREKDVPLPLLLQYYVSTPLYAQYVVASDRYAQYYDTDNLLPPAFAQLVQDHALGR